MINCLFKRRYMVGDSFEISSSLRDLASWNMYHQRSYLWISDVRVRVRTVFGYCTVQGNASRAQ